MWIVIDANIAASALVKPGGWTARQVNRQDITWFAPSLLRDELTAHAEVLARKTGISTEIWRERVHRFLDRIESIVEEDTARHHDHELVQRAAEADPDDAAYMAALVAVDAEFLWTRDRALLSELAPVAIRVPP